MYRRILVPLDGSTYSERVLAYLPAFVTPGRTRVILLRVLEPYHPYSDLGYAEALEHISAGNLWTEAEQYLKGLQGELRAQGIAAQVQVMGGDVTAGICAVAEDEDVDLIAMTTHGRSGVSRWALGSIADHVVRVVSRPVLLVRGDTAVTPGSALERILVPLDGTPLAEQALPQAQELASERGASLLLMRALDLKTERELDGILAQVEGYDALRTLRARAVEGYLAGVRDRLEDAGVGSRSFVHDLSPAKAILETAEQERADLIVMSTHARSGLGRWMYGSVADGVLRGAPCPVLLERARKEVSASHYAMPLHQNGCGLTG
jgi:nucleotide-binding universal stress UspA family protein